MLPGQAVGGDDAVNWVQPQARLGLISQLEPVSMTSHSTFFLCPIKFLGGVCISESLLLGSGMVGELRKSLSSDALVRVCFLTCKGLY